MDVMQLRRGLIMGKIKPRLPNIYREIQWLDTVDTNPYIDTGLCVTDEMEVELRYYNTRNEAFVFGARYAFANPPYFNLNLQDSSNSARFDCYNIKKVGGGGVSDAKLADVTFSFKNRRATFDNHTKSTVAVMNCSACVFDSQANRSIYLFAIHTGDDVSTTNATGTLRIYYARFWVGEELCRDFVPCIRKADNEPGMYDLVTKQFYAKLGSGNFVAGPDA